MATKIEFTPSDRGHLIQMPDAELTYGERAEDIPGLVQGWFGFSAKKDVVPADIDARAQLEVRVLEVTSKDSFTFKDLMMALEHAPPHQDEGHAFVRANVAHLIAMLAQHDRISVPTEGPAILAIGSMHIQQESVFVPGAVLRKDALHAYVNLFERMYRMNSVVWSPGRTSISFLIVRDAPKRHGGESSYQAA